MYILHDWKCFRKSAKRGRIIIDYVSITLTYNSDRTDYLDVLDIFTDVKRPFGRLRKPQRSRGYSTTKWNFIATITAKV